jgi:hypothetical protein
MCSTFTKINVEEIKHRLKIIMWPLPRNLHLMQNLYFL